MHHLVGSAEIADLLGVTRQRVQQLANAAGFPAPEVKLTRTWVWKRARIERWAAANGYPKGPASAVGQEAPNEVL